MFVATAHADDNVSGFVAHGTGTLTGRVTTEAGKPLGGVAVHVVSRTGGERTVMADKDGYYRVQLVGGVGDTSMIFVRDHPEARVEGETAVTVSAGPYGEAIDVRATVPPAVMAVPLTSTDIIPDYSAEAKRTDVWAKTWLMLDVSPAGTVERVKFLKRAGAGLDQIAMRDAFELRFEPARDRAARPIQSLVLWSYEWPSYRWLRALDLEKPYLPPDVTSVTCQKPGEHRAELRDCTGPDLAHGLFESWIVPHHKTRP